MFPKTNSALNGKVIASENGQKLLVHPHKTVDAILTSKGLEHQTYKSWIGLLNSLNQSREKIYDITRGSNYYGGRKNN